MMMKVSKLLMCAIFIIGCMLLPACSGCSASQNDTSQQASDEGNATSETDYTANELSSSNEDSSEIEVSPFAGGELVISVVNGEQDKDVLMPMSVLVENIDATVAVPETEIPIDGSSVSFGTIGEYWLQTNLVRFPVYSDMTTYNYSENKTRFGSDYTDVENGVCSVEIDLSNYSKVSLTKTYLQDVLGERIHYYEVVAKYIQEAASRKPAEEAVRAAKTVERCNARVEKLQEIQTELSSINPTKEELLALYDRTCKADWLYIE